MKTNVKIGSAKASLNAYVLLQLMGIWKPESISWEKMQLCLPKKSYPVLEVRCLTSFSLT